MELAAILMATGETEQADRLMQLANIGRMEANGEFAAIPPLPEAPVVNVEKTKE